MFGFVRRIALCLVIVGAALLNPVMSSVSMEPEGGAKPQGGKFIPEYWGQGCLHLARDVFRKLGDGKVQILQKGRCVIIPKSGRILKSLGLKKEKSLR